MNTINDGNTPTQNSSQCSPSIDISSNNTSVIADGCQTINDDSAPKKFITLDAQQNNIMNSERNEMRQIQRQICQLKYSPGPKTKNKSKKMNYEIHQLQSSLIPLQRQQSKLGRDEIREKLRRDKVLKSSLLSNEDDSTSEEKDNNTNTPPKSSNSSNMKRPVTRRRRYSSDSPLPSSGGRTREGKNLTRKQRKALKDEKEEKMRKQLNGICTNAVIFLENSMGSDGKMYLHVLYTFYEYHNNISHFYFLEHNLSSEQRLVGAECAKILFPTFPLAGLNVKVTHKNGDEEELQCDTIGDIGSVEEYADITLVPREDIDEEELKHAFAGKIWCLCLYTWLIIHCITAHIIYPSTP